MSEQVSKTEALRYIENTCPCQSQGTPDARAALLDDMRAAIEGSAHYVAEKDAVARSSAHSHEVATVQKKP